MVNFQLCGFLTLEAKRTLHRFSGYFCSHTNILLFILLEPEIDNLVV